MITFFLLQRGQSKWDKKKPKKKRSSTVNFMCKSESTAQQTYEKHTQISNSTNISLKEKGNFVTS